MLMVTTPLHRQARSLNLCTILHVLDKGVDGVNICNRKGGYMDMRLRLCITLQGVPENTSHFSFWLFFSFLSTPIEHTI